MAIFQRFQEMRKGLGVMLLTSHLAIAVLGAGFLLLSLYFHESLSHRVFNLVLENSPRVELLHEMGMLFQRSQASLQETILAVHGSREERQEIWDEIWIMLTRLEKQAQGQSGIPSQASQMDAVKGLLNEIYIRQWEIADIANTPGDAASRNRSYLEALPLGAAMRDMIDGLLLLLQRERVTGHLGTEMSLLFMEIRMAVDRALQILERIGYQRDAPSLRQYDESMRHLSLLIEVLGEKKTLFSDEMVDISNWLQSNEEAWEGKVTGIGDVELSVSRHLLSTELRPLTRELFTLLTTIMKEVKGQLDRDTAVAIAQSSRVVWGSRFFIALMLALAVWMARRGTAFLTAPLANLNNAALEYGAGNLSIEIPVEGSTELMTLSRTFNTMRDSLQESVGLMQSVLETAADGIIRIDSLGRIEAFNRAAERIFGWEASEVMGQNVSVLVPRPQQDEHDGYIQRFLESRKPQIIGKAVEVEGLRKDGKLFPIHLSVSHVEVNGRHIFTGIVSDITGQKKFQTDLLVAKERAEAANHAKAAFLANMSHEIRTPMNAVIGFADVVLQDQSLSQETTSHVETIVSSGRALLSIINDILDVSKMESGKFTLETVCFHLPNAMVDAFLPLNHQAAEKNLDLSLAFDPGLPCLFMGDPSRLRQVILNLVGNAIKFTEKGYVALQVGVADTPGMLHFTITDTGIGMDQEQVEKVFDSFTQADQDISRRFGGTGLGTTISKQIVEMMEGHIWVESVAGQGSIFHFTVRMPEAQESESCLFMRDGLGQKEEYISPRLFHILLAEDIKTNAILALLRLEQQGHSVHWVENGVQAVQEFRSNSYDIILMDIQMPEQDGLDATREIRQLEQTQGALSPLPIVALTASVMREEHERCRAVGMIEVVEKPIDFDLLFGVMEEVVPSGEGVINARDSSGVVESSHIDFSSLTGLVEWKTALSTWHMADIYAKALGDFATEHRGDARLMKHLLERSSADVQGARGVAHSLKGLAGNLAISRVAQLATAIDADLKAGHWKSVTETVPQLDSALKEVARAIAGLNIPQEEPSRELRTFDMVAVRALLLELAIALEGLSPDLAEPILERLAAYLASSDLAAIRSEVGRFSFDKALVEVNSLSRRLELG